MNQYIDSSPGESSTQTIHGKNRVNPKNYSF